MRWLEGCLDGLGKQEYPKFHVIMVDDASTDGSKEFVREHYPQVSIISNQEQLGFARTVNKGIRSAHTRYVVLLNTDTMPYPGWLRSLVEVADESPQTVGSFASKMLSMKDPDIIDDAGDLLMADGSAMKRGHGRPSGEYNTKCEVFSACAGAALYRREFLEETGAFDETFESYLEDVDLGLRGQLLGYSCHYVPSAEILHFGHGSGLPTGRYVKLVTRNRLMLLLKNIPVDILIRNSIAIIRGLGYHLVASRKPFASIRGYLELIPLIPHVLKERMSMQNRKVINNNDLLARFISDNRPVGGQKQGEA